MEVKFLGCISKICAINGRKVNLGGKFLGFELDGVWGLKVS